VYIIVSAILFFVVTVIYVLIIDIFAALFRTTGLSEEKARFQTISMLTNSGFTTRESELIVSDRTRRRLGRRIMTFGNVFSATVISVFINMVIALPSGEVDEVLPVVLVLAGAFIAFLVVKRIPFIRKQVNRRLFIWAQKRMYGKKESMITIVEDYPKGVVAEVVLKEIPEHLQDKKISEINMRDHYGVLLIWLRRKKEFLEDMSSVVLEPGDALLTFGAVADIEKLFGLENS